MNIHLGIAFTLAVPLILPTSTALDAQTVDSCTVTWSPIQQISFEPYFSAAPQLVNVGDTLHLMWGTSNGPQAIYRRSTSGGTTWQPPVTLLDTILVNRPYISGSSQYLYFFWSRCEYPCTFPDANYKVVLRRSLDAGASFLPRVTIASDSGASNRNGFTSASGTDVSFINFRTIIPLERFAWSSNTGVDWTFHTMEFHSFDRFALLSNGIHAAVEKAEAQVEVAYRYSSDNGGTWTPDFYLSTNDTITSDEPDIAGEEDGSLYVVWRDGKYGSIGGFGASIILRRSTDFGSTWLGEQLLTTQPVGLIPRIATDGRYVGVVWDDDQTQSVAFRFSADGGISFCPETTIASGGDPVIGISNGQIHIAWFNGSPGEIFYRSGNITTTSVDVENHVPASTRLFQNYPNPFNAQTTFRFTLHRRAHVQLTIYSVLGQEIALVVDEIKDPGMHSVHYDGSQLTSGVYFYRLQTSEFFAVKKLVVIQ
jgi:hypothetical protein